MLKVEATLEKEGSALAPQLSPGVTEELDICDDRGKPRLKIARKKILERIKYYNNSMFIDVVRHAYLQWVNFDEFLLFEHERTGERIFVKCSKRGNDVYRFRTKKRLNEIVKYLDALGLVYFDFSKRPFHVKSPLVFCTLTYSPDFIAKDWVNVGVEFNKFMSRLKKRYPGIKVLARSFQAQSNGSVHIHAVLYVDLLNYKNFFHGFRCKNRYGEITYRLDNSVRDFFASCWKHGFSDFQLCDSTSGSIRYLMKYIIKSEIFNSVDETLTYSLNWLFRKRSFSFSKDVTSNLARAKLEMIKLIASANNIILSTELAMLLSQKLGLFEIRLDSIMHFSNSDLGCWILLGVFDIHEVGLVGSDWVFKPPPSFVFCR